MKRIIPTRVIETGRVARGAAGQPLGWLQGLAERTRNLRAQVQGVIDRLNSNFVNGYPAAAVGEFQFKANTGRTLTIAFPTNPDVVDAAVTTLTVNPIIIAGETYRIPVVFTPPGVLEAFNLVVGVEAGANSFNNVLMSTVTPLNDYRQVNPRLVTEQLGFVARASNTNWPLYTSQQQVLGDFAYIMPMLPFLWNIIDEKSGRQLSTDWLPSGLLMNTRGNAAAGGSSGSIQFSTQNSDSEMYEFDAPWLFERDGQVTFLFRPIMDLYQIAAGDATLPYPSTDLSGGARNQFATVRVEFHGLRHYTSQDLFKDGARV